MYAYEFLIYHLEVLGRPAKIKPWSNEQPSIMSLEEIDYLFQNNTKSIYKLNYNTLPEDF